MTKSPRGIPANCPHPPRRTLRWLVPAALAVALACAYWVTRSGPAEPAGPEVTQEALHATPDGLRMHGAETLFTGFMLTHYPDGSLRSRSQVVDGRLHGVSEGWYPDGQIETRESFVRGVSHGVRLRWHANGCVAQIIHLRDGQPHGLSAAYFPNGDLQARVEMENGKPVHREFWNEGATPVD
jgi:hypothetical protein